MRVVILIVLMSFFSVGFSQETISTKDQEILRTELHRLINDLRSSKGLVPLLRSDTLVAAAQLQADYQAKKNKVTHDQKEGATATPRKRVVKSQGLDFDIVGENCISANSDYPAKKKELIAVANDMFLRWKDSPGHYKNMINPSYVFGDLAFSFNPRSKLIYGTQVFGSRGALIEGQLSQNAFGITEGDENCDQKYLGFQNILANMGNSIQVEGNEVVLYYHNINYWDRIFTSQTDGLAVDIVFRNQFDCSEPNKLDVSPIYDGILLEPIYKEELMQNNRAESAYRLITPIGHIPEEHVGKDMQLSLIVIDQGEKCKYLVPITIPRKAYNLRPIDPFMDNPELGELSSNGIIESQELIYDFDNGNSWPVEYPEILSIKEPIHSVEIICHTSIEGDTIINNTLHNNRAKTIERHLRKNISFNNATLTVAAEENWKKMNFQLQYFFADSLLKWPKDSIRKLAILENQALPWDSLLFAQRRSSAVINYKGTLTDTASQFEYLQLNLRTAIALNDWNRANSALYKIFKDSTISVFEQAEIMLDPYVQEAIKKQPKLVKNAAAIMTHTLSSAVSPSIEFINAWLARKDEISNEAMSNIIHLYTLTSLKLLDRWDVPSSRLANVIHPTKVNVISPELLSEELVLNLHLSFIQYYGQINDGPGITKSFDFISNYFKANSLSQDDDVDLCLFFNKWSRYDLTINYLRDKFMADQINENGVFVLLKTWYFYEDTESSFYNKLHEKAVALNQERFCTFIYNNFQTKRNDKVKQSYCKLCEE